VTLTDPGPRSRRDSGNDLGHLADVAGRITASVERVIDGKRDVIRMALVVLLAEGHLLIEDVPGVGKTMLAKTLARSIDARIRRIQFTPAEPQAQAALLECMEEHQVTVDGVSYRLEPPFLVIATQNPIEMEGTNPLLEAQRDRFTARVSMGYPSPAAELAMVDTHGSANPLDDVEPVTDVAEINKLVTIVRGVHIHDDMRQYVVDLVTATRRPHPELILGASPRATLHFVRAARARAALDGRDFVVPDDIQALAGPVLAHRLVVHPEMALAGVPASETSARLVAEILARVPIPRPGARGPYRGR
jgi:MoxR-like ATPase